eukprot:1056447-Pelagomonas_calceolata.AAC.1
MPHSCTAPCFAKRTLHDVRVTMGKPSILQSKAKKSHVESLSEKERKKERLRLPRARLRALRKGHLNGRAPPHRPRGRGGTEVYTS